MSEIMVPPLKERLLCELRQKFGEVQKLRGSESLYRVGDDAARLYFRYSKLHSGRRTFFGLRQIDLDRLEGQNSFLCFLVGESNEPVVIPFADFEEIFRSSEPARDGQYKVQLLSEEGGLQLYISKQGRFNVEGYVGVAALERSLDAERLRRVPPLSHSQVQTLLAAIGHAKGFEVRVPDSDLAKIDWSLAGRFPTRAQLPPGYHEISGVISEVDVIWIEADKNSLEALFEVEHSTPVYSGLLRFNDILLTNPRIRRFGIASNDTRRSVFARQVFRPTFRRSGLSELTSFIDYANVYDWYSRVSMGKARLSFNRAGEHTGKR